MESTTKPAGNARTHPSRFSLSTLFYITAVIAAAIALLGVWGIGWAVLVLVFWLFKIRDPDFSITELLVVILVVGILIGMLSPPRAAHRASFRTMHANQIRQIDLAILHYESVHGHFPPAYIADKNGTPMHSWRVLILPYLEQQAVFDQYDFDEPWNGPNNSKLADQLQGGPFASIPYPSSERIEMTGFKLVTGPGTAFVEDRTTGFLDILDGSSNVIMLVDDNAKPVNWMSPADVTLEEATELFDREKAKPAWSYEDKFKITKRYIHNVGMFDGAVQQTGLLKDPSEMREHFTIATSPKSPLDQVDFDYKSFEQESKPGGYILVAINFCVAILPAFWMRKKHRIS